MCVGLARAFSGFEYVACIQQLVPDVPADDTSITISATATRWCEFGLDIDEEPYSQGPAVDVPSL